MTNSQRLQIVRQRIAEWLTTEGFSVPEEIRESILIRDGFYCGRRFEMDDCSAVWFTEDDQVKIYDGESNLLNSFMASESTPAVRRAA